MPSRLEDSVRKTIRKYGMLSGGEHVLVGVSGGADSTALLLCLHRLSSEYGLTLTAAHLNHCIRAEEADADEEFVRTTCAGLGIPIISEALQIKDLARIEKRNLEEFARQARYEFLRRCAAQCGAAKIAVGHTLNDQAETALFRFIRGSGIQGLAGIFPVVDGIVIRPLLEVSRKMVVEYLAANNAGYREDSSNRDLRYSRNRIRHELLPYLQEHFNPNLIAALGREAELARESWAFIEAEAKREFKKVRSGRGEGVVLKAGALFEVHPALRKQVVMQALKAHFGSLRGIASAHIESILSLCESGQSGRSVQLPHGAAAIRQFDEIAFTRRVRPEAPFCYEVTVPGVCRVAEANALFKFEICPSPPQEMAGDCQTRAFLETSILSKKLTIRSRLTGDRYGGPERRKVKKMLIDRRIPVQRRSTLPMIAAGESVVWIPGFRPAAGYRAGPSSPASVLVLMERLDFADV